MAILPLPAARVRPLRRGTVVAAVLAGWVLLWLGLRGRDTLDLATADSTPLHVRLTDLRDWVDNHRSSNPFFLHVVEVIRVGVDHLTVFLQSLLSQPAFGRPVPLIGWLGVVALATFGAYALANLRMAVLTATGLVLLGLLGLWQESMDTLALTLSAVLLGVVIGIPLGIWVGLSRPVERIVTPVLDVMQTMPTFVYLLPLTLFFLIGPASAVLATLIYAAPPVIRLTAHGIQGVSDASLEASRSLGASTWQQLRTVQLPLARRTIVLGINQTTMAALSMVSIAALIDAPGLGNTVLRALTSLNMGRAFSGGLGIVILAVILDRVTTAASGRVEQRHRAGAVGARERRRAYPLIGLGLLTAVALYLAYTFYWAALFPQPATGSLLGTPVESAVDTAVDWSRLNLFVVTDAIRDVVSYGLLNPFEALLAGSPWYLVCAVVLALTATLAGARALITATICLALLVATGVWQAAMITLAPTIVATALVVALGVLFGVWLGRSDRADALIRPVLDAAQAMPAFVYLIPFVGLFGASRLTAIIAAVVFAAPVAIKIVADGIRAVPAPVLEAAIASGADSWQVISRVQLPLARRAVTLAANQGLIYVLSMIVVGALVGAGGLGYLVVAGRAQSHFFGKGLAAGIAIVLLGILLDRTTQAATRRARPGAAPAIGGRAT